MSRVRLSLRKELINTLADEFDRIYARLAPKQLMLFNDTVTRARYRDDILFSSASLMLGCGVVHMHSIWCAAKRGEKSQRPASTPGACSYAVAMCM